MKNVFRTALIAVIAMVFFAQSSDAQFRHRGNWLGPVLTVATDPIGFGVQYEHGVSENVGIGGIIRYWGKSYGDFRGDFSWSIIMPQFQAAYHFMPGDQLDPYAGGRLGWAIYDIEPDNPFLDTSSGLFLTVQGGLRYFFNPKIAVNGNLEFKIAGTDYFNSGIGLTVGADFTL
ncbi:porin family protein [bacterium]|nr:porin family protein [bacterium]